MIFDDLLALLFGSLLAPVFEVFSLVIQAVVNVIVFMIEVTIRLFVKGFNLPRVNYKRNKNEETSAETKAKDKISSLILVGVMVCGVLISVISSKSLTLVAKDGHVLPYAAVMVIESGKEKHKRTDKDGSVSVSRFNLESQTIKDSRYVEQTWESSSITEPLVVRRTILGSGLDIIARKLLKPAD